MMKHFLLDKTLVKKIARATNALLILQSGYQHTITQNWHATDNNRCTHSSELKYHIMLVVPDAEERSTIEIMNEIRTLCQTHAHITPFIFRRKEAIQKINHNNADFSAVYRLGHCLLNADKKAFPKPGYARNTQRPPIPKTATPCVLNYNY